MATCFQPSAQMQLTILSKVLTLATQEKKEMNAVL
jgi:hypothetical protein